MSGDLAERPVAAMAVTPFDAGGGLDEGALRAHLRFLADRGVAVYLCSQGSGEGDSLTHDERLEVFRIGADELGGRCPVYAAGVGLGSSTAQARRLAQGAAAAGVDAVQVLGARPGGPPLRPGEVEDYFDEVVGDLPCQVHLSTNTYLTGYEVPPALLARLVARHPQVTALNVTDLSPAAMARSLVELRRSLPRPVAVRTGLVALLPALAGLGFDGALSFEANVAPTLVRRAWEALAASAPDAAERFGALLELHVLLSRWPNPRSLKDGLAALGLDGGRLRRPYQHLSEGERAELAEGLAALGIAAAEGLEPR